LTELTEEEDETWEDKDELASDEITTELASEEKIDETDGELSSEELAELAIELTIDEVEPTLDVG